MIPEQKSKLFDAIDSQEDIPPTNYPKEYVENKMTFRLGEVAIAIDGAIMMKLLELNPLIQQSPSAGAINIKSGIKELRMDGGDAEMLRVRVPSKPWLDLEIDTNPLHEKYDQKIRLNIAPVSLMYHAPTVKIPRLRKKLVLDILINPATLMISEGGIYAPEKPTIVDDLGVLSITTVESKAVDPAGQDRMKQLRE
ncbi:unnamed protein product, partial [Mesorhabditis belari]|uniref:Uncharacterized protein n=1 Tax=Mesorhabditis belari TaxID=2138241 RepID=A0AAF3EEU1_9BILA